MPLQSYALTTLDLVKSRLSIGLDDPGADAVLERRINAVSSAFNRATGRSGFHYEASITENVEGLGGRELFLSRMPIDTGVTPTIQIIGPDGTVSGTYTNFTVDSNAGIIYVSGLLPWQTLVSPFETVAGLGYVGRERPGIQVVYAGGYQTPQDEADGTNSTQPLLPPEIEEVVRESVVDIHKGMASPGILRASADDLDVEYARGDQMVRDGLLSKAAVEVAEMFSVRR